MISKTELERIENYLRGWSEGTAFQGKIYVADDSVAYGYMGVPTPLLHLVVDLPNGAFLLADELQEQGLLAKYPCKQECDGECLLMLRDFPMGMIHCEQSRKGHPLLESGDPSDLYVPLEVDAGRHPFTVCALYRQVGSPEILDPTGQGLSDLRDKVLRVVDPDFSVDMYPLSIAQGVLLSLDLDLEIMPSTLEKLGLCQE